MLVSTILMNANSSWHPNDVRAARVFEGKLYPFISCHSILLTPTSFKRQGGLVAKQFLWQVSTRLFIFWVLSHREIHDSICFSKISIQLNLGGISLIVGVVVLYCYLELLLWVYCCLYHACIFHPFLDGVGTCCYGLLYLPGWAMDTWCSSSKCYRI